MLYKCHYPDASEKSDRIWVGEITNLKIGRDHCEMDVTGRGSSFHLVFGEYENGRYLCIPGWGVGCELASYQDTFWNQEQLQGKVGKVDAITVVTAIKEAGKMIREAAV